MENVIAEIVAAVLAGSFVMTALFSVMVMVAWGIERSVK